MTWLRKSLCALAVASFVGAAASGCQRNDGMLYIVGTLAIDATDCIASPEPDAAILAGGTLDRALRGNGSYRAALLVASQLTPRGSREQLRVEPNLIVLRGAEVTLESITGQRLNFGGPNPYSTIGTGNVPPASGTEPGLGVTFADIVPAGLNIPDGTIVSRVRVFGETLGGTEVESNEYVFPIQVCTGCLVQYSPTAFDDTNGVTARYKCRTSTTEESDDTACVIGQDIPVACTVCSASNAVCRDPCLNCAQRNPVDCDDPNTGVAAPVCN